MMDFRNPFFLFLAVLPAVLLFFVFMKQRAAYRELKSVVSERFSGNITVYTPARMIIHFVMLAAAIAALCAAAAGPGVPDYLTVNRKSSSVIFIIDASNSMIAGDVNRDFKKRASSRIDEAACIARDITDMLPHNRYGLVSFSGVAAYHSPPAEDRDAVKQYLTSMRLHVYQKPGSDFGAALESLLRAAGHGRDEAWQAVLISDGERKGSGEFAETAEALGKKGVAVHCIAVGTGAGGNVSLFSPEDVIAGKRNPRIAKTVTTRKETSVLMEIAETTGGKFFDMEKGYDRDGIKKAIESGARDVKVRGAAGRKDVSHYFLIVFGVIFLFDMLVLDNRFPASWAAAVFKRLLSLRRKT